MLRERKQILGKKLMEKQEFQLILKETTIKLFEWNASNRRILNVPILIDQTVLKKYSSKGSWS